MGCYSELASDSFLLNQVGDAKNVTIFGCAFCANQSIAYAKGMSVIGESSLFGLRFKSFSTAKEAEETAGEKRENRNNKVLQPAHFTLLPAQPKRPKKVAKHAGALKPSSHLAASQAAAA